jgi:hypothetical protein
MCRGCNNRESLVKRLSNVPVPNAMQTNTTMQVHKITNRSVQTFARLSPSCRSTLANRIPYSMLAFFSISAKASTHLFVDLGAPPLEALHPTRENDAEENDHDTKGQS